MTEVQSASRRWRWLITSTIVGLLLLAGGLIGYGIGLYSSSKPVNTVTIDHIGTGPFRDSCPQNGPGMIIESNNSYLIEGQCLVFKVAINQNATVVDKCFYCWLVFNVGSKSGLSIAIIGNQTLIDVQGNFISPQFVGFNNLLRIKTGVILASNDLCLIERNFKPLIATTCTHMNEITTLGNDA